MLGVSNEELKDNFSGEIRCLVYFECDGCLTRMAISRRGECSYFALANAFRFRLRPETIKINGTRLPVIKGDDPRTGRVCLLTPKEFEQLRFHHYLDPAIVTGKIENPFNALLTLDLHIPDMRRHILTAWSHGIANLQKSDSPLLQGLGKAMNSWMYGVTGRGVDSRK